MLPEESGTAGHRIADNDRDRVVALLRLQRGHPHHADTGGAADHEVADVDVADRHHQLRAADFSDLVIDIGGLDLLRLRLRLQIADLRQERRVGAHVERRAFIGAMPPIDLRL